MASPHPISQNLSQNQPHTRSRSVSKGRVPKQSQDAARLSGFRNLKSLAVLDIDDMNLVAEIADSVKNSHSTLTELELSLSRALASQARKASHESDVEESTDEDFPIATNNLHPSFAPAEPVRNCRAQEEWKKQEALLGKILGLEPSLQKKPQMKLDVSNAKTEELTAANPPEVAPGEEFITSLKGISSRLLTLQSNLTEFSASHQDILNTIVQAARKYVESDMPSWKQNQEAEKQADGADNNTDGRLAPSSVSASACTNPETSGSAHAASSLEDLNTLPVRQKLGDTSPTESNVKTNETAGKSARDDDQLHQTAGPEDVQSHVEPPASRTNTYLSVDDSARYRRDNVSTSHDFAGKNAATSKENEMDDYIRSTRGLAIEVLRIDLLPTKASVICRALNLSALKELTLLNVGSQAPIWTALAKENAARPLPLRSIFTDNVSTAFLSFASRLEELHELFLLERNVDHLPASFTPRASVTIDQIRRLVLKKHIRTLKRLMIKDESKEANWDANEKTMMTICVQGSNLEELAVSMNRNAVVSISPS